MSQSTCRRFNLVGGMLVLCVLGVGCKSDRTLEESVSARDEGIQSAVPMLQPESETAVPTPSLPIVDTGPQQVEGVSAEEPESAPPASEASVEMSPVAIPAPDTMPAEDKEVPEVAEDPLSATKRAAAEAMKDAQRRMEGTAPSAAARPSRDPSAQDAIERAKVAAMAAMEESLEADQPAAEPSEPPSTEGVVDSITGSAEIEEEMQPQPEVESDLEQTEAVEEAAPMTDEVSTLALPGSAPTPDPTAVEKPMGTWEGVDKIRDTVEEEVLPRSPVRRPMD